MNELNDGMKQVLEEALNGEKACLVAVHPDDELCHIGGKFLLAYRLPLDSEEDVTRQCLKVHNATYAFAKSHHLHPLSFQPFQKQAGEDVAFLIFCVGYKLS